MLDQALQMKLELHENYVSVFFHQFLSMLLYQICNSLDVLVGVQLSLDKVELLVWQFLKYKDYIHTFRFHSY